MAALPSLLLPALAEPLVSLDCVEFWLWLLFPEPVPVLDVLFLRLAVPVLLVVPVLELEDDVLDEPLLPDADFVVLVLPLWLWLWLLFWLLL